MSATARRLEIDEIAGHLDQIRATVIGRIQRGYPKVAREDLEDAYGDLCAEALTTSFGAVEQLEAWVQRALRRDAIDILRSARRRKRTALDPPATNDLSRGWCRIMGLTGIALFTATTLIARNLRIHDAVTARQAENERRAANRPPPKHRTRRRRTAEDLISAASAPP
jgi:DNA-directed RNA polymerase specialized sigma24 family protein